MEEILEQQLLIWGRAFVTFSTIEKVLAGPRKAFAGRVLCRRGLHESDRQSQPSRWGCHSWELQDQSLAFCRRFGIASIFSTEPSALDRFSAACDRARMKISKNTEVLCLSETQGSVYCKWAATHCSRWRSSST